MVVGPTGCEIRIETWRHDDIEQNSRPGVAPAIIQARMRTMPNDRAASRRYWHYQRGPPSKQ